jgi:hypothetical protein
LRLIFGILLLVLALPSAQAAESSGCVYPEADGGGPKPSKPSVQGLITKVDRGVISVRSASSHETDVRIGEKTQMSTVYGGYVAREKLAVGQTAYVWYVGYSAKRAGSPPMAAVVQLESR